jgi:hypothetical protein
MTDTTKKGLFIGDDGTNLMFTFILVSSLFSSGDSATG